MNGLEVGDGLDVGHRTRILTQLLRDWARSQTWHAYRELGIPIVPSGSKGQFGRLDLVIFRPRRADLVIEIDSAHNQASVDKLEYARDAGAVAVWLRWGTGAARAIEGVAVLDMIGA